MVLLQSTTLILLSGNVILNLVIYSECHSNYEILPRNICTDAITTKWNKNLVGESLRKWIISLRMIGSILERETDNSFLNKTVMKFKTKNKTGNTTRLGVYYISNYDFSKQKDIGPKWRKASIFSTTQFDDGFLYSNEDDNGEFTG